MSSPAFLRFGIPSIDRLLGPETREPDHADDCGILLPTPNSTTSICLVGRHGSGKSVLAMHLASRYIADCHAAGSCAGIKALYVSTDLSASKAYQIWRNFDLEHPKTRHNDPFTSSYKCDESRPVYSISFERHTVDTADEVAKLANDLAAERSPELLFIDLAQSSAGDDWAFLSRLLASLDTADENTPGCRHLVIVDAIEGFEALVGTRDAYGAKLSRRSRIAEIMRLAARRCHIVFVCEEAQEGTRLAEEFVADVVVRLQAPEAHHYNRRTIEFEKVRGQTHARGKHAFTIRRGNGSTTGPGDGNKQWYQKYFENPDDPKLELRLPKKAKGDAAGPPILTTAGPPSPPEPKEPVQSVLAASDIPAAPANSPFDTAPESGAVPPSVRDAEPRDHGLAGPASPKYQSYVYAFGSLHFESRKIMEKRDSVSRSNDRHCAAFGIPTLDNMLIESDVAPDCRELLTQSTCKSRAQGLPYGYVTALIGDTNTQKTDVGHAFLGGCFEELKTALADIVTEMQGDTVETGSWPAPAREALLIVDATLADLHKKFPNVESAEARLIHIAERRKLQICDAMKAAGAAVLLTTIQDIDAESLAREFAGWIAFEIRSLQVSQVIEELATRLIATRIVCRRLEVHDLSTPILMHIVRRCIDEGTKRAKRFSVDEDRRSKPDGHRIRVVIDDFSTWKEIYPDIRDEPLFLPALLFYLRRENVAALIVDSHPGRPGVMVTDPFDSELRALVDHHLYTWRVQFFGESRIAIAAMPPMIREEHKHIGDSGGAAPHFVVRELKWGKPGRKRRPNVDPHFELYTGIEEGRPAPVGLDIRLFTESDEFSTYAADLNEFLGQFFSPAPGSAFIVRTFAAGNYNVQRDFCALQRNTRLDHTLIMAVDCFWSHHRHSGFRSQAAWLNATTWFGGPDGRSNAAEDPFSLFRPGLKKNWRIEGQSKKRRQFFEENGYSLKEGEIGALVDRSPFAWDFGFLLCDFDAWLGAHQLRIPLYTKSPEQWPTVKHVWERLPMAPGLLDIEYGKPADVQNPPMRPTWREFLGACKLVADSHSVRGASRPLAFDVTLTSSEGLSCLILEILASEAYDRVKHSLSESMPETEIPQKEKGDEGGKAAAVEQAPSRIYLDRRSWGAPQNAIIQIRMLAPEFYLTWLLLLDVMDLGSFSDAKNAFEPASRNADPKAVAARHWYKSACAVQMSSEGQNSIPVGLPGHFSVRGDWFLAVASASRSSLLADRALDVLSSRRANFTRLQAGLGLPTRDIEFEPDMNGPGIRSKLSAPFAAPTGEQTRPGRTLVSYRTLCSLGENAPNGFHWLWRSSIANYDLVSTVWQKWLIRVAAGWNEYRRKRSKNWTSGFELYDGIRSFMDSGASPWSETVKKYRTANRPRWDYNRFKEDVEAWLDGNEKKEQFSESWGWFSKQLDLLEVLFRQAMGGHEFQKTQTEIKTQPEIRPRMPDGDAPAVEPPTG